MIHRTKVREDAQKSSAWMFGGNETETTRPVVASRALPPVTSRPVHTGDEADMMRRLLLTLTICIAAAGVAACHKKGATEPTPTPTPPAPTRIIGITGDLAFGNVNIGDTAQRQFTISNTGNAALTFTSLTASGGTGATGYAASPTSGTVGAGGSVQVTMQFKPTQAQFYSHVLTVNSDQTNSGGNQINVSGTGVNNNPIFTMSGKGNFVFDMPSYVNRVHVTGHFVNQGGNSNFIVFRNGSLMINEILRNQDYDGTHQTTGGGRIEIQDSSSIQWTFTELR